MDTTGQQRMAAAEKIFANGQFPEAERILSEILAAHPDHAEALNDFGAIAHARGDYELATDYFEKAIAADPAASMAWLNLADTQLALAEPLTALFT